MSDVLERAAPGFRPKVALILGSGLGGFVDEVAAVATLPYADLPGFPRATVGGHAGRLVLGHVGQTPVAVLQGRTHYYEHGRADAMKVPVRTLQAIGCEALVLTNAAGSLDPGIGPGAIMAISDQKGWFKDGGIDLKTELFTAAAGPKIIQALGSGSIALSFVNSTAALLALSSGAMSPP